LLKKSVAQVARQEKRIQDRELEIKNLEVRLETEAEIKRAVEDKNAELLEGLKDAPMDVIMAALYLESETGWMPHNTYAISAPVPHSYLSPCIRSRAEKKKKCRIVCRTHGVGSAHHARSDGIPVSVPAVVPQGLAVLLVDGATQTDPDECISFFNSY
nr:hypothetical protein [Tanacetum cinerariifolium]